MLEAEGMCCQAETVAKGGDKAEQVILWLKMKYVVIGQDSSSRLGASYKLEKSAGSSAANSTAELH